MTKEDAKHIKPLYTNPLFWVVLIFLGVIISSKGRADNMAVAMLRQKDSSPVLAAAAGKSWKEIKAWSGAGVKKTEPFTITGDKWRIKWTNKDESSAGSLFQGHVLRPGKEIPTEVFGNSTKDAADETYVYKDGDFYLSINSANSDWSVTVEEYK